MRDKENATVASLPHGDQRKLEVALLMALEPRCSCSTSPRPA
jgi:branched-chain amino acid transport system ATP-binding protein